MVTQINGLGADDIGIDPKRSYPQAHFLIITGMSRQRLAEIRRSDRNPEGLIIRDAGGPWIHGEDWDNWIKTRPAYQPKRRANNIGAYNKRKAAGANNA